MRRALMMCLIRGGTLIVLLAASPAFALAGVRETVKEFESGKNRITVDCFAPTAKGTFPLVLLLHGSGGLQGFTHDGFKAVARNLASKGYVTLIPHLFDHEGGEEQYKDVVKDTIAFAIESGVVDEERIGIIGLSMGAYLAMTQADADPRVKAIVSVSGSAPTELPPRFPPTLILHGSHDEITPVSNVKKAEVLFKEKKIPCEVHIYARTGHNLDVPKFLDAGRRSGVFFDKYLKPAKTPPKGEKPLTPPR